MKTEDKTNFQREYYILKILLIGIFILGLSLFYKQESKAIPRAQSCILPPSLNCGQTTNFDLSVTGLSINTLLCGGVNTSTFPGWQDYMAPSSTAPIPPITSPPAPSNQTCPVTQQNRPVEIRARVECSGNCPRSEFKITLTPPREENIYSISTTTILTSYPSTTTFQFLPQVAYSYRVKACVNPTNQTNENPNNNCKETTLKVFDYQCYLGWCAAFERNPDRQPLEVNIQILTSTDAWCRWWRSFVCRGRW